MFFSEGLKIFFLPCLSSVKYNFRSTLPFVSGQGKKFLETAKNIDSCSVPLKKGLVFEGKKRIKPRRFILPISNPERSGVQLLSDFKSETPGRVPLKGSHHSAKQIPREAARGIRLFFILILTAGCRSDTPFLYSFRCRISNRPHKTSQFSCNGSLHKIGIFAF